MLLFIFIAFKGGKDLIELEGQNFITAFSIDENKQKKLEVVTLSADLDYFEKNSLHQNKKYIEVVSANSISDAFAKINAKAQKNLYLGHTQIIFIGRKIFENKPLLAKISEELENNVALSHKIKLIFTDDAKKTIAMQFSPKLLDFIKNKSSEKNLTIDKLYTTLHEAL